MFELLTEKGHFVCDDKYDDQLISLQDEVILATDSDSKIAGLEKVIALLTA